MDRVKAVIDIGSNSVRLMLKYAASIDKFVTTTRLAEGMAYGVLQAEPMERTIKAVVEYVEQARSVGAEPYIYATEAVRTSSNSMQLIDVILTNIGIQVRILSGEEEAKASFYGAFSNCNCKEMHVGVVDIGGASTEIIVGDNEGISYSKSAPYGIVRLKDYAGEDDTAINEFLSSFDTTYGNVPPCDVLIGIGGTLTSLAAIRLNLAEYSRRLVDGTELASADIEAIRRRIAACDYDSRCNINGLSAARIDTIYGGIRIAQRAMKLFSKQVIRVSESDNLEGFLYLLDNGLIVL